MIVDTPLAESELAGAFVIAGWAVDPSGAGGTGIDAVHVWAYPATGGAPLFLGAAAMEGERGDVAAIFGTESLRAGYGLYVDWLPPGRYELAVFARRAQDGIFLPAQTVAVVVQ